jgi:hypoxanthine phosphoribosyltransferase
VTTASSPAWPGDIGPTFLSEKQIQQRVAQLGAQISRDYAGKDLIAIGILKGVFPFMADLLRTLTIPITVDFLAVSRYGPSEQTRGVVNLTKDLDLPLPGRHALLVEDIIDTGLTTNFILRTLRLRQPKSLKVCTLLNRNRRRIIDLNLAYVGFDVPLDYVVGYGLDFQERYRNLPYIAKFDPDSAASAK